MVKGKGSPIWSSRLEAHIYWGRPTKWHLGLRITVRILSAYSHACDASSSLWLCRKRLFLEFQAIPRVAVRIEALTNTTRPSWGRATMSQQLLGRYSDADVWVVFFPFLLITRRRWGFPPFFFLLQLLTLRGKRQGLRCPYSINIFESVSSAAFQGLLSCLLRTDGQQRVLT